MITRFVLFFDQNQAKPCREMYNKQDSGSDREDDYFIFCKYALWIVQVALFFFELWCKNPNKAEFMSNQISHSWPYLKNKNKTDVWGVVCILIRLTESLETSPTSDSVFTGFRLPVFSGVRALSLTSRWDADGWMTVG